MSIQLCFFQVYVSQNYFFFYTWLYGRRNFPLVLFLNKIIIVVCLDLYNLIAICNLKLIQSQN